MEYPGAVSVIIDQLTILLQDLVSSMIVHL